MAIPSKSRQRKWREKQADKKQVTLMMSKPAHKALKEKSKNIGDNFSSIVDQAIMRFLKPDNPPLTKEEQRTGKKKRFTFSAEYEPESFEDIPTNSLPLNERIATTLRKEKELLQVENERFQLILNSCHDAIWFVNFGNSEIEYVTPSSEKVVGLTPDELIGHKAEEFFYLMHPADRKKLKPSLKDPNKKILKYFEYRTIHPKLGEYRWVVGSRTMVYKNSELVGIVVTTKDIHRRKQAELALRELRDQLQKEVKKRTASLEEANIALTLMLKKEHELKDKLEGNILSSLKELVLPYVEKLRESRLDTRQQNYIDILESNLSKIVSPFSQKLSSSSLDLTPSEIQVADLIRHGRNTKEIAGLLNLSIRTIEFHRANIRKKVGIKNKKISLRSYLMSLE